MDNKELENEYRSERKERLAKAAKKKSKKQRNSTDIIAGVIKAIAIVIAIGLVCGALYLYGVPQSVLPALKVGGRTYSVAEYSYYYASVYQNYVNTAYNTVSQYGVNLSGFDYTVSPADQTTKDDDGNTITYDQFFRNYVQETLENYGYYLNQAKEQGVTLSEESQKSIDSDISELATSAANYGYSTSRYISVLFGKGLNEKKLRSLLADQYLVQQMITAQQDELKDGVTMDQINAEYEKDPTAYQAVDLRLLGIKIDSAASNTTETPTEAPTESSSETPTETATESPTEAPTETATEAPTEAPTESATEAPSTEPAEEPESSDAASNTEESTASNAEILAKEMLSKVTDEASFIELCKEYCAEDQKETFEDPSASLAIGIKKETVSKNIDENLADWLFADGRKVGDKTTAVSGDYAYVIMVKNTAYRNEDPLASARHILISFADVEEELKAGAAESTEPTSEEPASEEPASEEPASEEPASEEPASEAPAAETETPAAEQTTPATDLDGNPITADGTKHTKNVVLEAYKKALNIYNEYMDGEKTEDAFAALAEKYSNDTASIGEESETGGGLYKDIAKGQMVAPFEDWVYAEGRQPGDVGIVKTTYGWHVMYYVSAHEEAEWIENIRNTLTSGLLEDYQKGITEQTKDTASTTAFTKLAGNEALNLVKKLYVNAQ